MRQERTDPVNEVYDRLVQYTEWLRVYHDLDLHDSRMVTLPDETAVRDFLVRN